MRSRFRVMDAVQIRRESCKTDRPQGPDKPDKCPPRALFCWQEHVAGSQMQHLPGPAAQGPAHLSLAKRLLAHRQPCGPRYGPRHFIAGRRLRIGLTTLYSFCSQSRCTDGANPAQAGLIQATNGDFYGTTDGGGAYGSYGTVFKITPGGNLTTLHRFCSQSAWPDGGLPNGLVQATNGDFYGTTLVGGNSNSGGTVFKITASGTLTTLYSFRSRSGCTDGFGPAPGLLLSAGVCRGDAVSPQPGPARPTAPQHGRDHLVGPLEQRWSSRAGRPR